MPIKQSEKVQDQINQIDSALLNGENELNEIANAIKSEYFDIYKQKINKYKERFHIKNYWQKLRQSGIKILPKIGFQQKILLKWSSKNHKIMIFNIYLNRFVIQVIIYNVQDKKFDVWEQKNFQQIDKGSFGSIIKSKIKQSIYVLKKTLINNQDKKQIFFNSLRQYALVKLFSAFQITLQTISLFGFDIVSTNDALYFGMEQGVKVQKVVKNINRLDKLKEQMTNNLLLMHKFQFIHFDIKPANIMYSRSMHKFVLIDFGVTASIKQTAGQLTLTKFKGSFAFSSPQLQQIFRNHIPSYADLYYNDILGLNLSFDSIQRILSQVITLRDNTCQILLEKPVTSEEKEQNIIQEQLQIEQNNEINQTIYDYRNSINESFINESFSLQNNQIKFHQPTKSLNILFIIKAVFYIFKGAYMNFKKLIHQNHNQWQQQAIRLAEILLQIDFLPKHIKIYVQFFQPIIKKNQQYVINSQLHELSRIFDHKRQTNFFKDMSLKSSQKFDKNQMSRRYDFLNLKKYQRNYIFEISSQKITKIVQQNESTTLIYSDLIFEVKTVQNFQQKKFLLYCQFLDKLQSMIQFVFDNESDQQKFQKLVSQYMKLMNIQQEQLKQSKRHKGKVFIILDRIQKFANSLSQSNFQQKCILNEKIFANQYFFDIDYLVEQILPQEARNLQGFFFNQNSLIRIQIFFRIMESYSNFLLILYQKFITCRFFKCSAKIEQFLSQNEDFINKNIQTKKYSQFFKQYLNYLKYFFQNFHADPQSFEQKNHQFIQYYLKNGIRRIQSKYQMKQKYQLFLFQLIQCYQQQQRVYEIHDILVKIENEIEKFQNPCSSFLYCEKSKLYYQKILKSNIASKYSQLQTKFHANIKNYSAEKFKQKNIQPTDQNSIYQFYKTFSTKVNTIINYHDIKSEINVQEFQQILANVSQYKLQKKIDYKIKFKALIDIFNIWELKYQIRKKQFYKLNKNTSMEILKADSSPTLNKIQKQFQKLILQYPLYHIIFYNESNPEILKNQNQRDLHILYAKQNQEYRQFKFRQILRLQAYDIRKIISITQKRNLKIYCFALLAAASFYSYHINPDWATYKINFVRQVLTPLQINCQYFIQYYYVKALSLRVEELDKYRKQMQKRYPVYKSPINKMFHIHLLNLQFQAYYLMLEKHQAQNKLNLFGKVYILPKYYIQNIPIEQLVIKVRSLYNQIDIFIRMVFDYYDGYLFFDKTVRLYRNDIKTALYLWFNRLIDKKKWDIFFQYMIKLTKLVQNDETFQYQYVKMYYDTFLKDRIGVFKFHSRIIQKIIEDQLKQPKQQNFIGNPELFIEFLKFHYDKIAKQNIIKKQKLLEFNGYCFFVIHNVWKKLQNQQKYADQIIFFSNYQKFKIQLYCWQILNHISYRLFKSTHKKTLEYAKACFFEMFISLIQNFINNTNKWLQFMQKQLCKKNLITKKYLTRKKNYSIVKFLRMRNKNYTIYNQYNQRSSPQHRQNVQADLKILQDQIQRLPILDVKRIKPNCLSTLIIKAKIQQKIQLISKLNTVK